MSDWWDDDALWATLEPVLFPPERLAATAAEVEALVRLAGLRPGADVLDLCCGAGRYALELARRGHRVTGVDRTAASLARAVEAARAEGLTERCRWVCADAAAFDEPAAFDLAVNLYTSFGYDLTDGADLELARRMATALRPGGVAVLEMVGKELLGPGDDAPTTHLLDGARVEARRTVEPGWDVLAWQWTIERADGARHTLGARHRLYGASDLVRLLGTAGFGQVRVYGDFDGRPYDRRARCLVAVARR